VSLATPAASVQRAIATLAAGRLVVVVDDADREDEGDLVGAAELVTDEQMAFIVRHSTGIVCVPLPASRADELQLGPMVAENTDEHDTAFTISVDLAGTGTGV
jgi:3,4-dihydroxy 2-butanone 4-phosphate synthase / GTP cyclohydrolase II